MTTLARIAVPLLALGAVLTLSAEARADERYKLSIQVISAQPSGSGVDPALQRFSRDFQNMPYKSFKLLDSHSKEMGKGEMVSMQFPGGQKRFMKVRANGRKGDKHSYTISIDALNFRTSVRIPEGGTLIVGGPKYEGGVILLAVTARTG